jgi:uncharacterized membrane protein (UPF0127 family)
VSRSRRLARRSLAIVVLVLVLGGCGGGGPKPKGFASALLRVLPGDLESCVWVADTQPRRERGLMHVRDLADRAGMLFVFDADSTGRFWMRNTPMPLSIAFFRDDGRLVSVAVMAPCGDHEQCPRYAAAGPYRYALEVPRGDLDGLGVLRPGARIDVDMRRPCHTPQA